MPPAPVLLLHGLWMGRPAMGYLARRLRLAGFEPHLHGYRTVRGDPEAILIDLQQRWQALGPGPVHAVGHSLGGLTLLAALQRWPNLPPGRVLCLGSPLAGSAIARRLSDSRWMGWAVGRAAPRLLEAASIPSDREVGMIAGTRAVGMGQHFAALPRPHDGTVAVTETRVSGLADHRQVHASHTGLVFSAEVAELAVGFLQQGRFPGRRSQAK